MLAAETDLSLERRVCTFLSVKSQDQGFDWKSSNQSLNDLIFTDKVALEDRLLVKLPFLGLCDFRV